MSREFTFVVRRPEGEEELQEIAKMMVRFYRFNEEFDPLYALAGGAEETALDLVKKYASEPDSVVLVAVSGGKVVGFVHGELRRNPLFKTSPLGVIVELYVHPSYRRHGVARELVKRVSEELRKLGASAIAAEVPLMNEIAVEFYSELGFRPLTAVYVKELEKW
jgi:ribosomal protein S18 acetylase RimI-like enzyme